MKYHFVDVSVLLELGASVERETTLRALGPVHIYSMSPASRDTYLSEVHASLFYMKNHFKITWGMSQVESQRSGMKISHMNVNLPSYSPVNLDECSARRVLIG